MNHKLNISVFVAVLLAALAAAPAVRAVSQRAPANESPERSLQIMQSLQRSIREKQDVLASNQKILEENAALLQQNLATLYKIRGIKSARGPEPEELTEAIRSNLEAQRENQNALREVSEALSTEKRQLAKNDRLIENLQGGGFVLDLERNDDSSVMLERLSQSIRKNRAVLERNRERLQENQASLHENKLILTTLNSN